MHRKGSKMVAFALVLGAGALMAWLLGVANASAAGSAQAHAAVAKPTVITVTAGKPSEFAFKVSKISGITAGTVTFKVTNGGKAPHDFKICTKASANDNANACVGKKTPLISPGKSATLTVTLSKNGTYEFLCDVVGHAKAGMKGLLGIGVKVTPTPTPIGPPATGGGGATIGGGGTTNTTPCATPTRATTVTVGMTEYAFQMSQTTIPCGTVTFVEVNKGSLDHNIDILGAGAAGAGPVISGGLTQSFTVQLGPGNYDTQCDVPDHATLGMVGKIVVTA